MQNKRIHRIPVRFVFEGFFKVKASSEEKAREMVKESCGMVMGSRGVHSSLPEVDVDWEFPCHPKKEILKQNP